MHQTYLKESHPPALVQSGAQYIITQSSARADLLRIDIFAHLQCVLRKHNGLVLLPSQHYILGDHIYCDASPKETVNPEQIGKGCSQGIGVCLRGGCGGSSGISLSSRRL